MKCERVCVCKMWVVQTAIETTRTGVCVGL